MIIHHFIEVGITYLLAAMIPGPSVALIIKNGILYSRLASIKACLGTIVGTALQSGIILVSLMFLNNDSIILKTIKILGSLYLIYLGLKILLSRKVNKIKSNLIHSNSFYEKQGYQFFEGFLVEFLNPLAFTFFISIMTVVVTPQESFGVRFLYWIEIIILCCIWFFTVAFFISSEQITSYSKRFSNVIEVIAGCIFVFFGSKMFIC